MLAGYNKKLTTLKRPCLKFWHCCSGWKSPLHQQLLRKKAVEVECEKKRVLQVTLKSENDYGNFREAQTEDILSTTVPVLCSSRPVQLKRVGGRLNRNE